MGYQFIKWFNELTKEDVAMVGGKGANLGELTRAGIRVPPGFCVTADAYQYFVKSTGLQVKIRALLAETDLSDVQQLDENTAKIRQMIVLTSMPTEIKNEIISAYGYLTGSGNAPRVAVRSSATAEDLPEASFAGQQDTYLNILGAKEVVSHVQKCWASLWTARATYYRQTQKFDHFDVYLSAVVQKLVSAAKSGVAFTANPVTGTRDEIMINASWGLGEAVVAGIVTPDDYIIQKDKWEIKEKEVAEKKIMVIRDPAKEVGTITVPVSEHLGNDYVTKQCLSDDEIINLSKECTRIEKHYGSPQDIEWAYDNDDGQFYLLQARPITTLGEERKDNMSEVKKEDLEVLVKGMAASPGIASGKVTIIRNDDISGVKEGDILVTIMTNPDMVPAMSKAAAIVTDEGGRTCHAAIVSRELGVPCIVGCKNATDVLKEGQEVTVDATRGVVYKGKVDLGQNKTETANSAATFPPEIMREIFPVTATKVYMNLGEPSLVEKYKNLPFDGIGLMRVEFIFTNMIKAHPMYLIKTGQQQFMIDKLAEGLTSVAQAIYPRPVVVRMSDFRTNEFRGLKGGEEVEPIENNPMIGWRGVSRYISEEYLEGFRAECKAMRKAREEYGLTNIWAMLPFVRTTWELKQVKAIMEEEGLKQGLNFKLWIMAEVPSVIFMADEFSQLVDGFSIGSNDLTQLILGADRDSGVLDSMGYFDERDPAIKRAIAHLIETAHKYGKTVSICGQGPSIYPEFTEFLVKTGIDSVSVNPDTVIQTRRLVASVEQKVMLELLRGKK
ncbi:phosphoenolpyruvate synthase [Desulforamulus reducens MI-1]|uniref:Phosphoenolpyruvate synthase n=1 Tax=Desulforamulus reducens (strain ATCC BAA-1160 / DSM 100696 / MI-1) TaxID=349161 RepID=A4J7C3_DESRM|nr:phosphoenolpyruvate synthase [Desulforamulus reducens]ABO50976.1 phosphoenolpyruvate synthase [Desulforamulus reducens MI-1]